MHEINIYVQWFRYKMNTVSMSMETEMDEGDRNTKTVTFLNTGKKFHIVGITLNTSLDIKL